MLELFHAMLIRAARRINAGEAQTSGGSGQGRPESRMTRAIMVGMDERGRQTPDPGLRLGATRPGVSHNGMTARGKPLATRQAYNERSDIRVTWGLRKPLIRGAIPDQGPPPQPGSVRPSQGGYPPVPPHACEPPGGVRTMVLRDDGYKPGSWRGRRAAKSPEPCGGARRR